MKSGKRRAAKSFKWLDRGLIYGPYFTLCLTVKDYRAAMAHVDHPDPGPFVLNDHSNATTHTTRDGEDKLCAIVALRNWEKRTGIEIAGLLVHEATHIWQAWCASAGETEPGDETEAYSIQWISQQLMWEFERQVVPQ